MKLEFVLAAVIGGAGVVAQPVVDGVVSAGEWENSVVFPPVYADLDSATNERISIQQDSTDFYFLIQPRDDYEMIGFVMSLNVDRDSTTGLQEAPFGIDYTIDFNFVWAGSTERVQVVRNCGKTSGPAVNPTCEAATSLKFTIDDPNFLKVVTVNGANRGIELRIPKARFANEGGLAVPDEFDFTFEVGVKQLLPDGVNFDQKRYTEPPFSDHWLPYYNHQALPACSNAGDTLKSAILFSDLGQQMFYQDKAFSQLYASMQYQAMQAGLPYDRISYSDLLDLEKMCQYKVVIFPFFAHAYSADFFEIARALHLLRYKYGVGIITANNFLTNVDLTADPAPTQPYTLMRYILGISDNLPVYAQVNSNKVRVTDTSDVFSHLQDNQLLGDDYILGLFTNMYVPYVPTSFNTAIQVKSIATQTIDIKLPLEYQGVGDFSAILTSEQNGNNLYGSLTGRVCHFATIEIMANVDLVWPCMQWITRGSKPNALGLYSSRFDHLMTMRNDCDQSMYFEEINELYTAYNKDFLLPMYNQHDFVGSYYVNVGENAGSGQSTDWTQSKPYYDEWLETENELGSHSYNHPSDINLLTNAELQHEFGDALSVIKQEMGLSRASSAQPGATEELRVAKEMEKYHGTDQYFSGGFSSRTAGFPGAFGYLDNQSEMVYVAPNYFFDFTMIGFYKWTAQESLDYWLEEIVNNTKFAKLSIGHWPIHDYGPTNWGYGETQDQPGSVGGGPGYTLEMFSTFIETAKNVGHEFATTIDLADRIRAFAGSTLEVSGSGSSVKVSVSSPGQTLGRMALAVMENESTSKITSVTLSNNDGWYAFSDTKVFLPSSGIDATVNTGSSPSTDTTRIIQLPMRAELERVDGNGIDVSCEFTGRGIVNVRVASGFSVQGFTVTSSSNPVVTYPGNNIIRLNFNTMASHSFTIIN